MLVVRYLPFQRALTTLALTCTLGSAFAAQNQQNPPYPAPMPPTPPANTCPTSYCYNVDIQNNTGDAMNDLHVTLNGPTKLCSQYLGTWNPFGAATEAYAGPNKIEMHWYTSNWVQPGDIAHVGFCTASPVAYLTQGHSNAALPPFYWTKNKKFTRPIIHVDHAWQAELATDRILAEVTFVNVEPTPIRIRHLDWAVVDDAIALDDLMWVGLEGKLEWQPLLKDHVLEPGSKDAPTFLHNAIPLDIKPGDARHIVFRVWAEDPKDPSNMNRAVGQASIEALTQLAKQTPGEGAAKVPAAKKK